MSTTTLHIIEDYVGRVRRAVKLLQTHFGHDDLLRAMRDGNVPRHGSLDHDDVSFSFHGIGCRIRQKDAEIDFDFGADGEISGFDLWRLYQFVDSSDDYDSNFFTKDKLKSDIEALIASGVVLAPKREPSPHLLYLAADYG